MALRRRLRLGTKDAKGEGNILEPVIEDEDTQSTCQCAVVRLAEVTCNHGMCLACRDPAPEKNAFNQRSACPRQQRQDSSGGTAAPTDEGQDTHCWGNPVMISA